MDRLQVSGAAEAEQWVVRVHGLAQQNDRVPFILEPLRGDMLGFFDDAHHRNRWRRVDGAAGALVVKTDIASGHRRIQDAAGLGKSAHRFLELPENLRVVRVAEVQVVGHAERSGAGTGEVARRLGDRDFAAFIRIQINIGGIAIHRQRDEFLKVGQASRLLVLEICRGIGYFVRQAGRMSCFVRRQ